MILSSKITYLKKYAAIAGLVLVASFSPMFAGNASAAFKSVCSFVSEGGVITRQCFSGDTADQARAACADGCTSSVNCGAPTPGSCAAADEKIVVAPTEALEKGVTWAEGLVLKTITGIINFINSYLVIAVAWAAGMMDAAINIAMAPLQGIGAIETGWRITRDAANVFFIFFLLTIAIATILRIERYGAKALLAKLIIAAILINFSLVIAQVVVDASNILGITFVSKIHPVSEKIAAVLEISKLRTGRNDTPPKTKAPFSVAPGTLSAVASQNVKFANNIEPLDPTKHNPEDVEANNLFFELMIFIFQLMAMFIFLGLAILFIIRTVALMLIFILAPLGFLFSVLPVTQSYANEWWKNLFSWSFFFPASTFMLYIAISFGYELRNINFQGNQATNQGLAFATVTMICLLAGSLIVARKMGIYGASAIINYGNKLQGRARGYLGKSLRYATVGAVGAGAGYAARGAGNAASTFLSTKAAQRIGNIPVLRNVLRPIAAATQQSKDAAKNESKRLANLSSAQQASMYGTLSAPGQREFFDGLNDKKRREFIKQLSPEKQLAFADLMRRYDLHKDVAAATGNLHRAMQIMNNDFRGMPEPPDKNNPQTAQYTQRYAQESNDFLGKLNNDQIKNIDAKTIEENKYFHDYFLKNARNFNDVTNSRDQINATQQIFHQLMRENNISINQSPDDIRKEIARVVRDDIKNEALARQIETNLGFNVIINPAYAPIRSTRGQQQTQQAPTP
jgi:hypothetical protein